LPEGAARRNQNTWVAVRLVPIATTGSLERMDARKGCVAALVACLVWACGDESRDPPRGQSPVGPGSGPGGSGNAGGQGGTGGALLVTCEDDNVHCERYFGDCAQFPETHTKWEFLSFDTTTPEGAEVRFDVRTADEEDALSGATWSRAATATHDDEDAIPSAPIRLDAALDAGERVNAWLELRIVSVDSSEGATPAVESWDLTFTCDPN
jgi:hypothetical protein